MKVLLLNDNMKSYVVYGSDINYNTKIITYFECARLRISIFVLVLLTNESSLQTEQFALQLI